MNKADRYYLENLNEILTNGCLDENPRPKYKDGTPAHTKFINQVCEIYDISKGEFPITTLRNTAVKTGIKEILAIYQSQVNSRIGFEANDVTWWEPWFNENGNIGRAYSYNLESHRPNDVKKLVVKIKPRIVEEKFSKIKNLALINPIKKSIDDKIYFNRYIVIGKSDKTDSKNRKYFDIQFLDTGYITSIRKDRVGKSKGFDKYERKTYGIGFIGEYDTSIDERTIKILMTKWESMFRRCNTDEYYENYSNVFIHNDWHSFSNFLSDVRYLPQYNLAKEENFENWELDKDYYGGNCYSKETCVFLKKNENLIYRNSQIKPIKITENNEIYYELTYSSLAIKLNLSITYVRRLVKRGFYKNLIFSFIDDDEYLYRYELSRNQINELLINLKKDPFGRRHIISFWNWANIDKKTLVECAYETLWSVRKVNGIMYLDMTLIQRSNDYLMAGYINKGQYLALQMMIAGHLGYEVGVFTHFVQNLHIYDRHFESAKELIERGNNIDDSIQPKLILKENKNFYDYTINDFEIIGVEKIKKLENKLEIAI